MGLYNLLGFAEFIYVYFVLSQCELHDLGDLFGDLFSGCGSDHQKPDRPNGMVSIPKDVGGFRSHGGPPKAFSAWW